MRFEKGGSYEPTSVIVVVRDWVRIAAGNACDGSEE
jgi:hypothetical protein